MLNYVSGTAEIGKRKKKTKTERKAEKEAKKKARKEGKKGSLVAKIGAAPARNAFLGLLRINFLKLADKLHLARKKNATGLNKLWTKLGGKTDVLNKTIDLGKKIAGVDYQNRNQVGAAGAAALVAAATPVLIVVTKFIKESGLLDPKEEGEFTGVIAEGKEELLKNPEYSKDYADQDLNPDQIGIAKPGSKLNNEEEGEEKDNTILFLGLGAAALLLLNK